jgi:hypothetical protein
MRTVTVPALWLVAALALSGCAGAAAVPDGEADWSVRSPLSRPRRAATCSARSWSRRSPASRAPRP